MRSQSAERLGIEKSVNISDFRKNPSRYFLHGPVEVLSRRRPIGYLIDAELFETMLEALARHEKPATLKKELGLTDAWLRKVTREDR
jgi:PHD/YefM family antitoxin component YafN of YafNO toxin-antitoxin module